MNDVRKVGLWILAIGLVLMLAMAILMAVSRTADPNGVPILPSLLLAWGGLMVAGGLVTLLVGAIRKKSHT